MELKKSRIAVLCGGVSSEREISLKSGKGVHEALTGLGYDVFLLDARGNFMQELADQKAGFVFVALHGKFGEDGTVQAMLAGAGFSYAGSGPEACRNSMDKVISRRLFARAGLLSPRWETFGDPRDARAHLLSYPLFVKPACGGSSIGVSLVKDESGLAPALAAAFEEDERVILEERVAGREMAVGILGDRALWPIEVSPQSEFFDFEAKYGDGGTRYAFPEDLSEKDLFRLKEAALAAHRALGCAAFSRVDIIWSGAGPYLLEVNAIPGMTPRSLLPKEAAREGIGYGDLCVRIMEESLSGVVI